MTDPDLFRATRHGGDITHVLLGHGVLTSSRDPLDVATMTRPLCLYAVRTLRQLHSIGVTLAVFSDTLRYGDIRPELERRGILELFGARVYQTRGLGDPGQARRAYPDLYRKVLADLEVPPEHLVLCGTLDDARPAARRGIRTVHVGWQARPEKLRGVAIWINHVESLPGLLTGTSVAASETGMAPQAPVTP